MALSKALKTNLSPKRTTSREAKRKVMLARGYVDARTEYFQPDVFTWENELFRKHRRLKPLNRKIRRCGRCKDLNIRSATESAPGFGDPNAKIMFVAQSLGTQNMSAGMPYVEGSCYILDATLHLSGLLRKDIFITNVVHCHPPRNRPNFAYEEKNCLPFLKAEIRIVHPKLIIAMGASARNVLAGLGYSDTSTPELYCVKHTSYYPRIGCRGVIDWILDVSCKIDQVLYGDAA